MFAVGVFLIRNVYPFNQEDVHVGVKYQDPRFHSPKTNRLDWIRKSPPNSSCKRLFLETTPLLKAIMSRNLKSLLDGLKDYECERGNIFNWPLIRYVQPVDLNEKQKKTEIKVELPDGTNYQMVPFQAGNNEDSVTHIITICYLL